MRRTPRRTLLTRVLITGALTFLANAARAQTLFGARVGSYIQQEDLFVGGEILTSLGGGLYLNPNVEYVFADRAKQATFNFDLHHDFATRSFATVWVGGGARHPPLRAGAPRGRLDRRR